MKTSMALVIGLLIFPCVAFSAACPSLSMVWRAIPGRPSSDVYEYDMRHVNFAQVGDYPIQEILFDGRKLPAIIHVKSTAPDSCFTIENGDINSDPTFCTTRGERGLRWFSDIAFAQLMNATPASEAWEKSVVEYQCKSYLRSEEIPPPRSQKT